MPKGGAHFTTQEIALVLSHYDIGIIQQIKPLIAGNSRAPKQIVVSDKGKYLLKRRAKGKDDRYRVAFAHTVQQHLKEKNFPVPSLVKTCDEKNSFLEFEHHIYELFEFVSGIRFEGKMESIVNAGGILADFHNCLRDFSYQMLPLKGSFHDSGSVRGHLKEICSGINEQSDMAVRKTAISIMSLYNNSSVYVNQLGFDDWPVQLVHGDWHPGNMLFSSGRIVAVLDFDSLKVSSKLTDIANGALQFSIVGGRPNPADWPDYLDQSKLVHFIVGYCEVCKLEDMEIKSLPDLMIETLIAEAVLPIAATGFFANLSGTDFLAMIQRKCAWIDKNRQTLYDAIEHGLQDLKE